MLITIILTFIMCVLLFLMIWSAVYFFPWKRLLKFMPEDIQEKAKDHRPPFMTAPTVGRICLILCTAGFIAVIVYGGWDGVQKGYTFTQFLIRFMIILFGVKAFDIIGLDYILITKTQFIQHYLPETKECKGYHSFGYNRKEQLKQIVSLPFCALLTSWICSLF
ncbi:MAG: hypothetical protein J6I96_07780 [Oscillospiraceae bacterium]|nr:hypothetical protein [Oscillospiraceae bacterium]